MQRWFDPDRLRLMAIVNLTPDSFSPSSRFTTAEKLINYLDQAYQNGIRCFDVGAQSTAPKAEAITLEEELARWSLLLSPGVQVWMQDHPAVIWSADTFRGEVVEYLLTHDIFKGGLQIWNDIAGTLDQEVETILLKYPALQYVHMFTGSRERAQAPFTSRQVLVAGDISKALAEDWTAARQYFQKNFSEKRLILDWGIGFGKAKADQHLLVEQGSKVARQYFESGYQGSFLMGISRKSFMAAQAPTMKERDQIAARFYGQYAHELHAWKDRFYWRQHVDFADARRAEIE